MQLVKILFVSLCLFSPLCITPALAGEPATVRESDSAAALRNRCEFRSSMRKLWEDHITWTRLYIISDVANLPDKAVTTRRLLKNQQDLGAAIMPFYGRAAGAKLAKLLTDHILIASKVVQAARLNKVDELKLANAQWYANSDDLALFFSQANPREWELNEMKQMMHKHLALTTNEAVHYIQKSYAASAADYDQVHLQAMAMADMLSAGIMQQFPRMFQ